MSIHSLKLVETTRQTGPRAPGFKSVFKPDKAPLLGRILHRKGQVASHDLISAVAAQIRQDVPLGVILRARGVVSEADLQAALAEQFAAPLVDLDDTPPEADLMADLSPEICLKLGFIPWRCAGHEKGRAIIATSDPARLDAVARHLPGGLKPFDIVIVTQQMVERHVAEICKDRLSHSADTRCPAEFSCRRWARPVGRPKIFLGVGILATGAVAFPRSAIWILFGWVMLNLVAMGFLRLTALVVLVRNRLRTDQRNNMLAPHDVALAGRLPKVSVLVPLYKENNILPKLVARLATSDYPKELLDICLVLESGDDKTLDAVRRTDLPGWMRAIIVPPAALKTKPRAMNYALDFCHGDIIGIYDAEDAPERDQISRIVRHFARAGPEVACIQAYLDYYNPRQNWLSRCFTIEYAMWFRVVLQAVEHMRLPVPLGGTSVFFRRRALEDLGAWDAHNVTEDADLGMRLARRGYRCAFEPTTTYEEANCHPLAWIKQRSRWLKGYAMTWITHMRAPRRLWCELGPKGFLTFQIILLGTLSSFLLAPAIWSFWLIGFGFAPGFMDFLPRGAWSVLGKTFVATEIIQIILGLVATSGKSHRFLMIWVPAMIFYWPLGTIAAFKAIYELLLAPFYWDKTSHGIRGTDTETQKSKPV